ncbi:MAG: terminase family protein [Pseudomonadota bacterium]
MKKSLETALAKAAKQSTTTAPDGRSWADWLSSQERLEREAFVAGLSSNAALALEWLFEVWALPGHQMAPPPPWRTWVILGGRGAGKTRAGSEWVRAVVEGATPLQAGECRRLALIGDTVDQVREVMIEGPSGLRAVTPPDRRPVYEAGRKRLVWPNGAEAFAFSAQRPEALRGPQFDAAWCDELAKWDKGRQVWDQLQLALRLGSSPRQVVTTTPRPSELLSDILLAGDTVLASAPTEANRKNLAPEFVATIEGRYGGTDLARQELHGELLTEAPGALWSRRVLEAGRGRPPELRRIVVAVDPPATSGPNADECGIVAAGIDDEEVVWVLEDWSKQGLSPLDWARLAVEAYRAHQADRIVVEGNQGGDMILALIDQVDRAAPVTKVTATRGKFVRAEPVAALYERGRVRHARLFAALEDQMCAFDGRRAGGGSPDRVDALVWAVTELALGPRPAAGPRVRAL